MEAVLSETNAEFWLVLLEAGEVGAVLGQVHNEIHALYDEVYEEWSEKRPWLQGDPRHRLRAARLLELLGSARDALRLLEELHRAGAA